ncbi:integrase [Lysinibacillus sp. PLM2]|nr:integrase [Lysinibacillus sp. PLM2]
MTKIVELIDDFKLNQEIQGRKKDYIYQCMFRLNRFKLFVLNELKIEDVEEIRTIHIKKYIQYKQQEGKENNRTINNNLATLKVFFQYLIDEEFIDEDDNPMKRIKNLKEQNAVIVTFNDDEVKRILCDVKEETYSNVRDKLILIFLFETGIRVSELCNIKESDISTKYILIHGKGSKQRLVHITKLMRRYMRKFESLKIERFKHKNKEDIEDYYFLDQSAQKLHRSRINKILKEHCENAKVRKEVRCSPHDCRHYFAQKSLKNGIDVYSLSRLMGHYDTQITSKYLRGLEQEDILKMGKLYSPLNDVEL